MTLTVEADKHLVHATTSDERHLLLRVTAPKPRRPRGNGKPARPGVNVIFVLDRSGSMAGGKIALARYAVERALVGLTERDRFAIVTFDDRIEQVAGSHKATDEAKRQALVGLQSVDARGSTALHGGWSEGAALAKRHLDADGVNRVLLLTDGLANIGETDPQVLGAFAADLRASGVATSTFGVGADFDETLLQSIADAGGGHFYFIRHPEQIPDYMTGELGEMLETVARGVAVNVKHAPGLGVRSLSPVAAKTMAVGETHILLGDLVAGQDVELVLALDFPPAGGIDARTTVFFTVSDRDAVLKADGCSIDFESADDAACAAEPSNPDVELAVARLRAVQARQEAVVLNRSGEYGRASRSIRTASASLSSYRDPATMALKAELDVEETLLSRAASELDRKAVHFRSANAARSRDPAGWARRDSTE